MRRGISPEAIALACVQDDIIGRYADMIEGGRLRRTYSAADAALDASLAERVWAASGLVDQLEADDEDVGMLRWFALAVRAGMPPDALLQLIRVGAGSGTMRR